MVYLSGVGLLIISSIQYSKFKNDAYESYLVTKRHILTNLKPVQELDHMVSKP